MLHLKLPQARLAVDDLLLTSLEWTIGQLKNKQVVAQLRGPCVALYNTGRVTRPLGLTVREIYDKTIALCPRVRVF